MPYTIEIDHTFKIIRNTYAGSITKEDLANVWRQLLSLKEFTELKYNLLSDYRKSSFDILSNQEDSMLEFLISIKYILNGKKEAVILGSPKDTALTMLVQLKTFESVGYIVKLFSTKEVALKWLDSPNQQ